MNMAHRALYALAIIAGALSAQAIRGQEVPALSPGHPLIDPSVVSAGVDTLELVILPPDGGERPVFSLVRTTRPVDDAGVPAWLMLQEYSSSQGINTDTSLVRRADLAPLRYGAVVGGEVHSVTFDGGRVEGTVEPADSAARSFHYDFDAAPFNAVMDVDLIRSLPLEAGFEASLATYNPPRPPAPAPTRVRVTGVDTLATADGPVPAWAVTYDAGGPATTLWIAVEDRRFLRLRTELQGGATFWKLHRRDLGAWRRDTERLTWRTRTRHGDHSVSPLRRNFSIE